tara:strand:- start:485 stop:1006 length:522 start_codon:yes stop_codon:yes gene_type:complete
MEEVKVIDNFLSQEEFNKVSDIICNQPKSNEFPWYIADNSDYPGDENYQLFHILYNNNVPYSNFFEMFQPLYNKLNIFSLFKVRLIATMKYSGKNNMYHTDIENVKMNNPKCKTAVFYFNTNDGGTEFEHNEQTVTSVANRMVIFPFTFRHRTIKHTEGNTFRYVLNLNYIEQ